ncbi:hypothetical protein XcmpCFBP7700_12330 [Xanthomonas campestris]|nr:hypothetical protein XcmpCFBP7700_12330 [Xanthomonas campestris]
MARSRRRAPPGSVVASACCGSGDQSGHNDHGQGRTRAGPGRLLPRRRSSFASPSRTKKWLILSDVHLDRTGGTGALLQHLTNACVLVVQSPRAAS